MSRRRPGEVLATLVHKLMHGAVRWQIRTSQNTKSAAIEVEDQGKGAAELIRGSSSAA